MLFPFCKPFILWLVRSGAVQQRNCTSAQPCQTGVDGRWSNTRAGTAMLGRRLACFQTVGSLTVTGTHSPQRPTFRYFDQTLYWFSSAGIWWNDRSIPYCTSDCCTRWELVPAFWSDQLQYSFPMSKLLRSFYSDFQGHWLFVCLFVGHNVSITFLKESVQWAPQSWKISF